MKEVIIGISTDATLENVKSAIDMADFALVMNTFSMPMANDQVFIDPQFPALIVYKFDVDVEELNGLNVEDFVKAYLELISYKLDQFNYATVCEFYEMTRTL